MRKLLSWILTVSMLLGMVGVTAFADDPGQLDLFEVTVGSVAAGGDPSTLEVSVPTGAKYDVKTVKWSCVSSGAPLDMATGETFADGEVYHAVVVLELDDGVAPAEECTVKLNGSATEDYAFAEEMGRHLVEVRATYVLGREIIDQVQISGLPAESAETSTDLSGLVVKGLVGGTEAPGCLDVTAAWYWVDSSDAYVEYTGATLGYGSRDLCIEVRPAAGYWLSESLKVEQEEDDDLYDMDLAKLEYTRQYDTRTQLSRVEITMDPVQVGSALPVPQVAAGQNVTLASYAWSDGEGNPVTGQVEPGKYYALEMVLTPDVGYGLEGTEVLLNGDEYALDIGWEDGVSLTAAVRYSFLEDVPDLEISVEKPVVGQALPVPTVPTGLHVAITDYEWQDENGDPVTGKAENAKEYLLKVTLTAEAGYSMENTAVSFSNGEDLPGSGNGEHFVRFHTYPLRDRVDLVIPQYAPGDSNSKAGVAVDEASEIANVWWSCYTDGTTMSPGDILQDKKLYGMEILLTCAGDYYYDEENLTVTVNGQKLKERDFYADRGELYVSYEVSFCQEIDAVEVADMKLDVQAGDAIPTPISAGDRGGYLLDCYWVDKDGNPVSGTFAAGSYYVLMVQATAKEGYLFADDVRVKVGGTVLEECVTFGRREEMAAVPATVNLGDATVISKIDLTWEGDFTEGGAIKDLEAAEGVHFVVDGCAWMGNSKDEARSAELVEGTFQADTYYWAFAMLQAKDGYTFDILPQVTVNGKASPLAWDAYEQLGGILLPGMGEDGYLILTMGKLEIAGDEDKGSPDTGDAGILLYAVMGTLSLAGATTVVRRGRRGR